MFTPRWKKDAKAMYKAGKKFLNYKRDLLKEDRIAEIESRLSDLKQATKGMGKEAKAHAVEAGRQLDNTCEQALPRRHKIDPIGENVEVIFVSLVVALGIRSYYVQPFIIPTGSMQPTLNGVITENLDKKDWPNLLVRVSDKILRGKGYIYKEAKKDLIVPARIAQVAQSHGVLPGGFIAQNPGAMRFVQTFYTQSVIPFKNGNVRVSGVPASDLTQNAETTLARVINEYGVRLSNGDVKIPKGTVLFSGFAASGDLILADKVSYHFRKPRRGETFIFDTRGLNTSGGASNSRLRNQTAATHYIKRCVGVPGDTLQIATPNLLVNGHPAEDQYIQRVSQREGEYADNPGYIVAQGQNGVNRSALGSADQKMILSDSAKKPWVAQYAAMGDNTDNSLDSRYWGPLEEYNVVAPALISLWPITTGHWGLIK